MNNLIERLNKFKKEFVKADLSDYKNKLEMFDELCEIECDMILYYARNKQALDELNTAARRTCEVDG